jgi:hypothetical protein
MDYLKTSAPSGRRSTATTAAGWVEAKADDDRAADRWR